MGTTAGATGGAASGHRALLLASGAVALDTGAFDSVPVETAAAAAAAAAAAEASEVVRLAEDATESGVGGRTCGGPGEAAEAVLVHVRRVVLAGQEKVGQRRQAPAAGGRLGASAQSPTCLLPAGK